MDLNPIGQRQVKIRQGNINTAQAAIIAGWSDGDGWPSVGTLFLLILRMRTATAMYATARRNFLNDTRVPAGAVVHAEHRKRRNRTKRPLDKQSEQGHILDDPASHTD